MHRILVNAAAVVIGLCLYVLFLWGMWKLGMSLDGGEKP